MHETSEPSGLPSRWNTYRPSRSAHRFCNNGDRDHDAFALWVLSSSERAVFNSSLRMSQKGRALLHSGDRRDRTPTCDLWHVRVVVLVMPKKGGGKTMAYQAEISRKNPGCFLFLVD